MPFQPFILLLTCFLLGLYPSLASAGPGTAISGEVTYGTAQYRSEVEGEEVRSITTNYQKALLTYNKNGLLGDSRLGKYSLMLGYEINRVAPKISDYGVNDPDVDTITSKKLLYNTSLLVAPGGLPFRLSFYARDIHQTTFTDDSGGSNLPVGVQGTERTNLFNPEIFTGMNNGTHRQLGATLLLGIRNGSYLGLYRDVLSQLPRLLIDYKQIEVRDLANDRNKTHYRSRDLAFVSLNKLDNWVHFRMNDYVDFLDHDNDYLHNQVLIGLIDQTMNRKWINMTNWLKVSGDLSYSIADETNKPEPIRTHRVNMMATGKQNKYTMSILSQFSRETNGNWVVLDTDLPIMLTVNLDRDTLLRTRLIYDARKSRMFSGMAALIGDDANQSDPTAFVTRDCYLDLQFELNRTRPVIFIPRFEVESGSENENDGLAARLGVEVLSNRKSDNSFHWLGGYKLTAFQSNSAGRKSSDTLENEIYGSGDKNLSSTWRIGGKASLANSSGAKNQSMNFRIPRMSHSLELGGGSAGNIDTNNPEETVTSSHFSLFLEHRYQQWDNRIEFNREMVMAGGEMQSQNLLRHHLGFYYRVHRLKWESTLSQGDNTGDPATVKTEYVSSLNSSASGRDKAVWDSSASYSYNPDRSFSLTLGGDVNGKSGSNQNIAYALMEKIDYRIYTTNGIIRRVAEFSEEIGYEKTTLVLNSRDSSLYGRFSAAYFPTRYLYGKVATNIVSYLSSSALQQIYFGEIGLNFEKLKVVASYSDGMKDRESVELPEVREKLWKVEVKKTF